MLWLPPAMTSSAIKPAIRVGLLRIVVSPRPNCPLAFPPHEYTAPSYNRARLCVVPADTALTPPIVEISFGTVCVGPPPSPS